MNFVACPASDACSHRAGWRGAALRALLGAAVLLGATAALAAPFEIAVSPSRFELSGKSGTRIGQTLEIHNLGMQNTEVLFRTIDWTYSDSGQIDFYDALQSGSCRPWVTLERPRLTVPARGKRSYRFQIEVPAEAPRGECRFMLAIEGAEPAQQATMQGGGASLSLPVVGRIAVAVYVALNGAEPKLELTELGMGQDAAGQRVPVLGVRNNGDAHGRLDGGLDATDANGQALTLVVEGTPVMPGQTRTLALVPRALDGQPLPQLAYPVKARGTLDWEQGGFKLDTEFK